MTSLMLVKDFIFGEIEMGIQVVLINGEPMFSAFHIAKMLGYVNLTQAVKQLCVQPIRYKYKELYDYIPSIQIKEIKGLSKTKGITLIDESDLYALILGSSKTTAKIFQRWVCKDVLPSIRKTGSYNVNSTSVALIEKDVVEAFNRFFDKGENIDFCELAGVLGDVGRNNLIKFLREKKIIQAKSALPYRKYIELGYFEVVIGLEDFKTKTVVSPKGVAWIYKKIYPQKTLFDFIDEPLQLVA